LLLAKGLWEFVDDSSTLADDANEQAQTQFKQKSQKAFLTITSQQYLVTSCEGPHEAWEALKAYFERDSLANKLFLIRQYFCTQMKDGTSIDRAREARANYKQEEQSEESTVRSVDLQKDIMLPRIKGCKTVLFTKRLVVFHETFAIVGSESKQKTKRKNISVIWHEGCAGRKAKEIASTIKVAIERERDMKHLTYWMDNCSSENKNKTLFTSLISVVNDPALAVEDITLKYFEPGHTFMSADSVHHGVEKSMKGLDILLYVFFNNANKTYF